MLDLHFVREHTDRVAEALRKRGSTLSLSPFREMDERRRGALVEVEGLKKLRNESSKRIGQLVKSGGDAAPLKEEMRRVGERIAALEKEVESAQEELKGLPGDAARSCTA